MLSSASNLCNRRIQTFCKAVIQSTRKELMPSLRRWEDRQAASLHTFSFPVCSDDKRGTQSQRLQRLYVDPIPKIQVVDSSSITIGNATNLVQTRFLTTTTATTTTNSSTKKKSSHYVQAGEASAHIHAASLSSTSSDSSSSSSDGDSDDDKNDNSKNTKDSWRSRAATRAANMRDNARESIQEFREAPGASMKSGAKSFSGMMQKYGPVFFGVHLSVYFATLAAIFAGVDSGLLDPVHLMSMMGSATDGSAETKDTVDYVVDWLNNHSWSQGMAPFVERNPHFASLAVAWIAVKFTEPIRLPVSIFLTPRVANYIEIGRRTVEGDAPAKEDTATTATTAKGDDSSSATK
mmetsp:Transcript_20216/g.43688  ORF Transcript_20216/g.43688 Transcript_20216/m.43688 type:complete len:350 (+) Transcript_20216:141-1190(+)|eukprot:CAMPEP_0168754054 /NCGR_PEP_ID=MMETSP0724-20121128/19294_1 /TAXON_ID=265536 /ORGANISM="Amphiprora sp., Strain CCMP467" /LENGTH=349 /DNA_ID=CAMNT_0008802503 /DNA_START=58 /DNA_END=1107 /DNA_ORIENTATION=-